MVTKFLTDLIYHTGKRKKSLLSFLFFNYCINQIDTYFMFKLFFKNFKVRLRQVYVFVELNKVLNQCKIIFDNFSVRVCSI